MKFFSIPLYTFECLIQKLTTMDQNIKPIKRSTQLAPLSREHHEGLLFVWKIRQGIKKEVHPERMIAFVQWFWSTELEPHFRKEENVLLPHLTTE